MVGIRRSSQAGIAGRRTAHAWCPWTSALDDRGISSATRPCASRWTAWAVLGVGSVDQDWLDAAAEHIKTHQLGGHDLQHAHASWLLAGNPTQVVREDIPEGLARGWPRTVPAWKLGTLAVNVDLRADKSAQWGRQLLRDALETIVRVADAGGGKVIVVDADNPGPLGFYTRNGFKTTGIEGDLALYMKVSTARAALNP